jgi:hypothetical protein
LSVHAVQEGLEARVGAQGIDNRVLLDILRIFRTRVVGLLQSSEDPRFVIKFLSIQNEAPVPRPVKWVSVDSCALLLASL